MRKRNLIFPLVVSSLFMPSIEAIERTTDLNSLENENNIYEAVDILIAEGGCGGGGGGGGGMSPKEKAEQEVKRQKSKDAAKKRIIKSKIAAGKPLTDKEKKFAVNQVINILKALKNSLKNGNDAYTQILLKELFFDYNLDIGRRGDYTPDNILRMIEMGDEGIDQLIKTFESVLFPPIMEIMGGGPNSLGPKIQETQDPNEGLDSPIGEGYVAPEMHKKDKKKINIKDNKRIREYKEAIEFNKNTKNGKVYRDYYDKVINLKKKINNSKPPKDGDFFEFLDSKYARLKQLDLIESFLVLLMSEQKKEIEFSDSRFQIEYNPNIDELEKQLEVLKGINLSNKYTNSFKKDFDMIRYYYANNAIRNIKTVLKMVNKNSSEDNDSFYEVYKKYKDSRGN